MKEKEGKNLSKWWIWTCKSSNPTSLDIDKIVFNSLSSL